jgi:NADH-quinone oxidoreductase subunit K
VTLEALMYPGNLILGISLFGLGAIGFLWKRDAISMFVCVELMLNAANLVFIAFARQNNDINGVVAILFIIAVAAAEAGVGLAIFICAFKTHDHLRVDDFDELKQ